MKLLVIGGDRQPIPPVHGGAVENLVEMFYDENEKFGDCSISVLSCYDKNIILNDNNYKSYKNVKFYMVDKTSKTYKINSLVNRILNKFFKVQRLNKTDYPKNIISSIEKNKLEFDAILIENYINAIIPLHKKYPDKKIFFHIHNDKLNSHLLNCKKIVDSCYRIICVSDYIKNQVCTISNAKDKAVTLINSIKVDKFGKKYKDSNLRNQLGIKDNEIVIIFAGRISKTKGVKELIESLVNIKENFKLLVVGNSWYGSDVVKDKYFDEIKKYSDQMKNKIVFTGYIDYSLIPKYYAISDLAVIPSIWQEPCSLALFECMASQLPLITTNTGGTPEVVKNNAIRLDVDSEFIDNLSKAIKDMILNKEMRNSLGIQAYNYVQQYNPKRYYDALKSIIINGEYHE